MERPYTIIATQEQPRISHADFTEPRTIYTLLPAGGKGKSVRVSLPRRVDWRVDAAVVLEDAVMIENRVDG